MLAVVAVGTNLTFPIWVRLAERETAALPFTLRAVRSVDRAVTIPAYLATALSGALLVALEGIPWSAGWIAASIALFLLLMGIGVVLYRPVSRERLAAVARGVADPLYRRAARRAEALDAAILVAALAILVLMVVRPG